MSKPDWNKDVLRVTTEIHLSFIDRIRVLLGKPIICESRTKIENDCGRVETTTRTWVVPFRFFETRQGAGEYVTSDN